MIKKILFFTLSNFGDVILTLPVLDVLRAKYPQASITVMVGPRASGIFRDNPHIHNLIIYNKYAPLREKIQLFFQLKKERFDVVIDLRNTLFGALLPAGVRTSPFLHIPSHIRHMKERNLYRLRMALRQKEPLAVAEERSIYPARNTKVPRKEKISNVVYISPEDKDYMDNFLQMNGITAEDKIVIVSPAAGGKTRRWEKEKFIQLCLSLARDYLVILIGRKEDKALTQYIQTNCVDPVRANVSNRAGKILDSAGLTNLAQLAFLLKKSSLVVVCDTGILHLASYLDIPVVGIFGPSDEQRYGPWSSKFKVIAATIPCRPCRVADCRFETIKCMQKISVNEVLDSIDALLKS